MDKRKEGGNVNRPPILDDTNYDYWKALMIAFIKPMDNKTWTEFIKGGTHQVVTAENGTQSLKPEVD